MYIVTQCCDEKKKQHYDGIKLVIKWKMRHRRKIIKMLPLKVFEKKI